MAGKSSLQNVLTAVLSVGNMEANQAYPPFVFQSHFNSVTSFLLDKLVATYPKNSDLLLPFLIEKKIPVTDGYVQLPDNYRNLLGAPSINVKPDGSDCDDSNPEIINNAQEFKIANLKSGCKSRPIVIVDKAKWDYLTTSSYDFPTYTNPIGMFVGSNRIKVCPYDLGSVLVTYAKNEDLYVFAYTMQPDDTYIFNPTGSVQSQWADNAFQYLFKGCLALYGAYVSDPEFKNFSQVLNQAGLL